MIILDWLRCMSKPLHYHPKRKYGNQQCDYKGRTYDSKGEVSRAIFLDSEEAAGRIRNLKHQERVELIAHGKHICYMEPDFQYEMKTLNGAWLPVVEDYKGGKDGEATATKDWKLKKKLYEAQYKRRILIVTKDKVTRLPTYREVMLGGWVDA